MFGFKESYIRSLVPHLDVPMEWGSSSISLNIWIHVFLFVFLNLSICIFMYMDLKRGAIYISFDIGFHSKLYFPLKPFLGSVSNVY